MATDGNQPSWNRLRGGAIWLGIVLAIVFASAVRADNAEPITMPAARSSETPLAIATFSSVGLYWAPSAGTPERTCRVQYRAQGHHEWRDALPLWFDARNHEYRGSVVGLAAGTGYEVQLQCAADGPIQHVKVATWPEQFPVLREVTLPAGTLQMPYTVTEGGRPDGYILYTAPKDQTVLDVVDQADNCLVVRASYVIVRGITLKNARRTALLLEGNVHDVVIEGCDISGWGRIASDGWGANMDAGIGGDSPNLQRIIIQRNRIHHPRSNSNDWTQPRTITGEKLAGHPQGPQAVVFYNSLGNHVIRYNEIDSDESHRFNDGLGGGDNFSFRGFPGPDSDIYGNLIQNACDDAIEAEGGNPNVRIWGNYMTQTFTGVATASCSVGPIYIFRNVLAVARMNAEKLGNPNNSGVFGKLGDNPGSGGLIYGGGRRYFFHNTVLQPAGKQGWTIGAKIGVGDAGGPMTNTVSRNNIWEIVRTDTAQDGSVQEVRGWSVNDKKRSATNDFDYDYCNGRVTLAPDQEAHGITGRLFYASHNGPAVESIGRYALDSSSAGYDQGVRLPNFNDDFTGSAPDVGAHEAGTPAMQFGIHAFESKASTPVDHGR